jgi:hypothetical protein
MSSIAITMGIGQATPLDIGPVAPPIDPATLIDLSPVASNTVQYGAQVGFLEVTVTTPAVFAGVYNVSAAQLAAGPINLVPAAISGTTDLGDTLTAQSGLWAYDPTAGVPTIAANWQSGGTDVSPAATGTTFDITAAEQGTDVSYLEQATDANGTRAQASNSLNVPTEPGELISTTTTIDGIIEITAQPGILNVTINTPVEYAGVYNIDTALLDTGPVNLVPAAISGTTDLGDTLTAIPGLWVYDPTAGAPTIAANWQSDGTDVSPAATGTTFDITAAEQGTDVSYLEQASDTYGARIEVSNVLIIPPDPADLISTTITIDGTIEITAQDGVLQLIVNTPAEYAGTYDVNTADLDNGPLNIVPSSISGTAALGETLTATPGLWVYDSNTGAPALITNWQANGSNVSPAAMGVSYDVTAAEQGTDVTYLEQMSDTHGARNEASNAISIPAAPSSFDPLSLFTASEAGFWLDPSDLSTMWTTSDKATQVSSDGDPIGWMDDKSGNENHFRQTDTTKRPIYRTDGTRHWLEFATGRALDRFSHLVGATNGMFFGTSLKTTDTQFILFPFNASSTYFGTANSGSTSTTLAQNVGSPAFRENGSPITGNTRAALHAAWATNLTVAATITDVNMPATGVIRIGDYPAAGVFDFNGNVYGVLCRSAMTPQELSATETYLQGLGP